MKNLDMIFKAMGDPTRIRIIQMLAENGEMCVCKIMEDLDMTQPAVSHHLSALKNAELVKPRKQGQWVHYSLLRPAITDQVIPFLQDISAKLELSQDTDRCCSE
ncbi:MAG: ArsR/SmtB family transcription factor [Armatimonadota bacterium]